MRVDNEEFSHLVDPFRRELLTHCYRMLGSVHDAEDAVQETYLRAWRSLDGFEGRSSVRHWLYRIATNVSLRALERDVRRPLPSGLGGPTDDPDAQVGPARADLSWLEPMPDTLLMSAGADSAGDPADVLGSRGSIRLAFIAALQHLPARQRAVLILRDVLALRAAEVADLLGVSVAAVNSMLQRARAQLADVAPVEDNVVEPSEAETRTLLDRYMAAFENADVADLERLLLDAATLEMPPEPTWFVTRAAVLAFFARVLTTPGRFRMVPMTANGQPASAAYATRPDGTYHAHAMHVLSTTATGIARIVVFRDADVVTLFGLPRSVGPGFDLAAARP